MSSLFGEVWFWSLLAFLIGAVLTWVLLVRPAQQRVQQLERRPRPPARRAPGRPQQPEAGYPQPALSEWPGGQPQGFVGEPEQQQPPHPPTQWLERDSLHGSEQQLGVYPADEEFFEREAQADAATRGEDVVDQGYRAAPVEEEPEGSLFEPADYTDYTDYTEYLNRVERAEDVEPRPHGGGLDAALNPADAGVIDDRLDESAYAPPLEQFDDLDTRTTAYDDLDTTTRAVGQQQVEDEAPESPGGLFAPTPQAAPYESAYTQPVEESLFEPETQAQPEAPEEEERATEAAASPDIDPATGLPKRRRGATSRIRGGFEPPRPIQPSVRPIARREPQAENVSSGSLFEPSSDTGESGYAADAGQHGSRGHDGDRAAVPAGPFGPGSAMPLPGGGRPAPSFTVKASVTALRYCTEDSPQFDRMVAEVWFAGVADAERVGFRPLA